MSRPTGDATGRVARVLACVLLLWVLASGAVTVPTATAAPQADDPVDPDLREAIGFYTGVTGQVDDPRAHDLLLEAAGDGDPLSQMWLARCYSRGRMLFDRDEERARELASEVVGEVARMARANVAEAAFLMGTAYAEALGVEADAGMAIAWYMRGADLGNVLSQHNLANAYRDGDGVPRDLEMAAYWYRRAAEQGDALTAYMLGRMYEHGEGVEQDLEQALRWYRVGAERGNSQAREALERLAG